MAKKKKKKLAKAISTGGKLTKKEVKKLTKIGVTPKAIKRAVNKAKKETPTYKAPAPAKIKSIATANPPLEKPRQAAIELINSDKGKLKLSEAKTIAKETGVSVKKVIKMAEKKGEGKDGGAKKIGDNATQFIEDRSKLKNSGGNGPGGNGPGGNGSGGNGSGGNGSGADGSGGNNDNNNGGKKKTGLASINTERNKDLYKRGMKAIGEKVAKYEKKFSDENYLKDLRARATERMSIKKKEYGRGTSAQENPSLAMRYDKGKKSREKLFSDLRKPLTDALSSKSNLSMFEGDKIDFSEKKMSSFVDSGNDLFADIKSAAGELGYKAQASPANRAKAAAKRIKKKPAVDSVASLKSKLYKKPTMV